MGFPSPERHQVAFSSVPVVRSRHTPMFPDGALISANVDTPSGHSNSIRRNDNMIGSFFFVVIGKVFTREWGSGVAVVRQYRYVVSANDSLRCGQLGDGKDAGEEKYMGQRKMLSPYNASFVKLTRR